jgi:hypothetical protein
MGLDTDSASVVESSSAATNPLFLIGELKQGDAESSSGHR